MSENLKVNAKSKILKFKEKHNKVVDELAGVDLKIENALIADKEIISKISKVYIEDDGNTKFSFPDGIIPLSIRIGTTFLYFKNGILVNYNGEVCENFQVYDYYQEDYHVELDIIGDKTETIITSLLYVCCDGLPNVLTNTYYLFHPLDSGGTKLYKHEMGISNYIGSLTQPFYVINTKSTPYSSDITELNISLTEDGTILIRDDNGYIYDQMFYNSEEDVIEVYLVNDPDNTITLTPSSDSEVTDTVTDL